MIAAIVLTFNSEKSIERTLRSLRRVTENIFVIDSFSHDSTVQICTQNGCVVVQRVFSNYADQRNWAVEKFQQDGVWQLHVDADEQIDDQLVEAIQRLQLSDSPYDGYIVRRRTVFMGRLLRFGGVTNWHMRLFRFGKGRVEDRLYDQHFMCAGPTARLPGALLDHQDMTLSEWTARHNNWSDFEARQAVKESAALTGVVKGDIRGNIIERKRYKKEKYYLAPRFFRVFVYFFYRYLFLLGALDGVEGMIYHVLQGFWFRFLVDAKIHEGKNIGTASACPPRAVRGVE